MSAVIIIVAVIAIVALIMLGKNPWDVLFLNPLINSLVLLDILMFGNFGLAIIVFTLLLRIATLPFTIRQLQSTRAMQAIQPEMQELQKKYKDPKRRQEELMRLYKENNINPIGCFMPLLIQMVVFIALYRALVHVVGGSPESLVGLSQRLYPIDALQAAIPLNQHFLWLDLGQPDETFVLPILVGLSTYIQQRLSVTPNANAQQQQQQQMLTWMMPMMLMFITLNLPSGVGVYWVVSNIFSLFASYYVYGRRILSWRQLLPIPMEEQPAPAARERASEGTDGTRVEPDVIEAPGEGAQKEERSENGGKRRGKRKKRR
jgi:YidC/Oxa1 family membrane protein insertase